MLEVWIVVAIGLVLAIPGRMALRALWRWLSIDADEPIDPNELIAVSTGLTDGEAEVIASELQAFGVPATTEGAVSLRHVTRGGPRARVLIRYSDLERAREILGKEAI